MKTNKRVNISEKSKWPFILRHLFEFIWAIYKILKQTRPVKKLKWTPTGKLLLFSDRFVWSIPLTQGAQHCLNQSFRVHEVMKQSKKSFFFDYDNQSFFQGKLTYYKTQILFDSNSSVSEISNMMLQFQHKTKHNYSIQKNSIFCDNAAFFSQQALRDLAGRIGQFNINSAIGFVHGDLHLGNVYRHPKFNSLLLADLDKSEVVGLQVYDWLHLNVCSICSDKKIDWIAAIINLLNSNELDAVEVSFYLLNRTYKELQSGAKHSTRFSFRVSKLAKRLLRELDINVASTEQR